LVRARELDDASVFQILVKIGKLDLDEDGRVSVEFRRKPCHSPNSSPASERADAAAVSEDMATATTLSTLSALSMEDKDALSPAAAATHSDPFSVVVRNRVDPFTRTPISELEDVLYLQFSLPNTVNVEMFAVEKPSFEEFVANAEKDGKSFDQLILAQVECDDGKTRNLTLDWEIWVESILPCSKRFRSAYFQMNVSGKARESKLRRIKEEIPDLWSRITYWIADCGDSDALERLEIPWEDGVPPYMSPFYFNKKEAIYLGALSLLSSHSLGDALRAKSATQMCAAHELAPFLEQAFGLKRGFHRDQHFRQKKQAWVSKRRAVVRSLLPPYNQEKGRPNVWRLWDPLLGMIRLLIDVAFSTDGSRRAAEVVGLHILWLAYA